ncbi:gluconolactonase [Massilia oculi]|uniref:Gluconolactonase n=2 Tax=Massilia oculi TaxID=945844 RepID=A0A2S2DR65_9BURK|nr:gluconolactonase [Massilia oculi]
MEMEIVAGVHCATGESPMWHAGEQAWYWVDIPARHIWRLDHASGELRRWLAPEMVACIAASSSSGGGLVAGMETGIFQLDLHDDGSVGASRLAAPPVSELGEGMRFNDGRCDRQGRFWSGTMFMDMGAARAVGGLYRYSHREGLHGPVVSNMLTQNGLAWSPDGKTMYLSDSHPQRRMVWAFDYDVDTGLPHDQRVFLDLNGQKGRPDGAAVDADGCYWTCANDGGVVQRYTQAGKLDREIELPMAKPSMCAFGGPDLDLLLVTSIDPAGAANPGGDAGAVVLLRPGVKGVAETPFLRD